MRHVSLRITPGFTITTTLVLFGAFTTVATAQAPQSSPPACTGDVATWNECSGTQDLKDGRKYVGEFRNGQFDGKGTLTWKDGDQYVGDFKAGIRNGNGTQTLAKVAKINGRWVDGKYAGP